MKILMRMGMSPFDNCSLYDVIAKDLIGSNAGNMLFPYSIMNNIYQNGMTIDPYIAGNEADARWINENYDMFLIPLANAFRNDYIVQLQGITKLIRKLNIPCIVIGVGMQADYEPHIEEPRRFDAPVLDFCKAVLEKSESIGVRGEITARYLTRLGVPANRITIIGCPSMFMYGEFLPMKKPLNLTKETKISICYAGRNNPNFFDFLEIVKEQYPNYCYILQKTYELKMLYAGDPVPKEFVLHKHYVSTPDSRSFISNKMRMFINVPSWINFLSQMDMGIGNCIHGSVASVLSGNPTLVFAFDSRIRELAEFHKIPLRKITDASGDTTLESIIENIDFSSVLEGHKERYHNFVNFLKANHVQPVTNKYGIRTDFEKRILQLSLNNPEGVTPYYTLPLEKQKEQLQKYLQLCEGKIRWCHNAKAEGKRSEKQINTFLENWERSKAAVTDNLLKLR